MAVIGLGCAADNPAFAPGAAGTGSPDADGTTSKGPPVGNSDGIGESGNADDPTMPTAGMTGAGDASGGDGPPDDTGSWDTGEESTGGDVMGGCPPSVPCTLLEGGIGRECGAGSKCQPFDSKLGPGFDVAYCAPLQNNLGHHGDPCSWDCAGDTCDAESVCIPNAGAMPDGLCHGLCDPALDWPCEDPNARCAMRGNYHACMPICDPLLQDCDGDLQCYFANGFVCLPSVGDVGIGEECQFHQNCGASAACLNSEDVNCAIGPGALCCAQLCSASAGDCPEMQNCISLDLPTPWDDVGFCEF